MPKSGQRGVWGLRDAWRESPRTFFDLEMAIDAEREDIRADLVEIDRRQIFDVARKAHGRGISIEDAHEYVKERTCDTTSISETERALAIGAGYFLGMAEVRTEPCGSGPLADAMADARRIAACCLRDWGKDADETIALLVQVTTEWEAKAGGHTVSAALTPEQAARCVEWAVDEIGRVSE